jgi:two-component system LytT family response regulator
MQAAVSYATDILTSRKARIFFCLTAASLVLLTMLQDLLLSLRNNNNYYWSESFLFNTFWLWFIPVIFFLWKKAPYTEGSKRNAIIFQSIFITLSGFLIHASLYASTVMLGSSLLFDHTYGLQKVFTYTIANDLYKYLLVYGLVCFLRYRSDIFRKKDLVLVPEQTKKTISELVIGQGKDRVVVATADIVMISSASPYIAIHTEKKKYLHTTTLRAITEQLDQEVFVRVHKSTIINTRYVSSYRSRLNGDYDILLQNQQETRLSRNYVPAFKQTMTSRSSG